MSVETKWRILKNQDKKTNYKTTENELQNDSVDLK
jgi:hypothetical protein